MPLNLFFNCVPSEVNRERRGYLEAFSRSPLCRVRSEGLAEPASETKTPRERLILLHPDPPLTLMPCNLPKYPWPTIAFQIDAFSKPTWRALWSALFDYVFVFHPGFERYFAKYHHPRIIVLPHAVNAADYRGPQLQREFDIGWIGSINGELYKTRRRVIPYLAAKFKMNDWQKRYLEDEVPGVYLRSRIVVNVGRDDHPGDANIRCFEAMAAGALLVTQQPSELEQLGFTEGEHFVGYRTEREIEGVVARFLREEISRREIAERARELVMSQHTYDARVATILKLLHQDAGLLFAPARRWKLSQIDYAYLHYYCKRVNFSEAQNLFRRLLRQSPMLATRAVPLLLRCCMWHFR